MKSDSMRYSKTLFSLALLLGVLFMSCSSGSGDALLTYPITRTAYQEVLIMEGYTESVNSVNIHCPPNVGGTITYLIESGTEVKEGDVVFMYTQLHMSSAKDIEI